MPNKYIHNILRANERFNRFYDKSSNNHPTVVHKLH